MGVFYFPFSETILCSIRRVCVFGWNSPPGVTVTESRRGSQAAETDFYSKPLKGQLVSLSSKGIKRHEYEVCTTCDKWCPCGLLFLFLFFCSQISFPKQTSGEGKAANPGLFWNIPHYSNSIVLHFSHPQAFHVWVYSSTIHAGSKLFTNVIKTVLLRLNSTYYLVLVRLLSPLKEKSFMMYNMSERGGC